MQELQEQCNSPTKAESETTQHQQLPQGMHEGDVYDLKLEVNICTSWWALMVTYFAVSMCISLCVCVFFFGGGV